LRPDRFKAGRADADCQIMERIRGSGALRRSQAWLYVGGGLILLAMLLAPDRDTSDHRALVAIAVGLLGLSVPLFLWRRMPDWALIGFLATGIVSISLCVGLLRPMVLTPVFYIWTFLLAAYHLSRWQIAAQYALMVVSYGAALAFLAEPQDRVNAFVTMTGIIAIVVVVILRLRERNERLVAKLRETATSDSLTGALNRGAFEEHLRAERARALRHGRPYSVAIIDVDHFKQVNDEHGHAAGDAALVRLAGLVRGNTRAGDVFARVGGEEFALLLTDTDLEQAAVLAEGLRGLVRRETAYDPVPLTVSIGVAAADAAGEADVMLAADRALYGAKRAGRDRVMRGTAGPGGVRPALAG
jgi:diguanylate cyclase (GGDEF)-like protein